MSCAFIECKKRRLINLIDVDEVYDEVHIKVPFFDCEKTKKYGKKICKVLKKYKVNQVVLSKQLCENNKLKNILYENNLYIIDGHRLYKAILKKVIEDICKINGDQIQNTKVIFFMHEFTIENMNLIKYIAKNIKSVILVSENSRRYERLSEELMQKYGIALSRLETNVKKRLKADFVINIDYTEKELKKYSFEKNIVIFSVENEIKTLKEDFLGIIINDVDIYYDSYIENFSSMAICESRIYDYRRNCKENERRFNKADYKINGYFGFNSKISEDDIKNVHKNE